MKPDSATPVMANDPSRTSAEEVSIDPTTVVLSADECELFAQSGRLRHMVAGERIFSRGDSGATMYVVQHGRVPGLRR